MKNSKIILSEEGLKRYLPVDLWHEILSRLPVKSLLRFRCVSKSWLSTINDPDFCRLHLENFKDNHDETHLLVIQGSQQNCVLRCSDTFEPNTGSTTLNTLGPRGVERSWNVEFSIDGLVLLKSCKRAVSGFHKLRVWNPSIRKFHDIPSLPKIEFPAHRLKDVEIGFGYDLVAKDYKHVKLIFVNDDILHSVAIYTLGARSWKMISFKGSGCFDWHWNSIDNGAVYLRGSLYFLSVDFGRNVVGLFSFDLSSEVFSCINLPGGRSYNFLSRPLSLVDDGSILAFFDFLSDTMWILDSSSAENEFDGWRPYSFGLGVTEFSYHKKNGDILIRWDDQSGLMSSYALKTGREKIMFQACGNLNIDCVYGYTESLIMLK